MPIVTIEEVEQYTGLPALTAEKRMRAELDLHAVIETLEGWTRRKFDETTIENERHYITVDGQSLFPHWGPVKTFLGYRHSFLDNPLVDASNPYWEHLRFRRGSIVYINYVTDNSLVIQYQHALKKIIIEAVIAGIMKPIQVRYKIINSYTVEGLSIQYGAGQGQQRLGDMDFFDLSPILPLKRRVIA